MVTDYKKTPILFNENNIPAGYSDLESTSSTDVFDVPNESTEFKFLSITAEMFEVFKRKNSDYGNSIAKTYEEYGLISLIVRILDKVNRLVNLSKKQGGPAVADESIKDTLTDLANYCVLSRICLEKSSNDEKN